MRDEKFSKDLLDATISSIDETISRTMRQLLDDSAELLRFGYELKKKEGVEQMKLERLIAGLEQDAHHQTLIDIINSNTWNDELKMMQLDQRTYFRIEQYGKGGCDKNRFIQFRQEHEDLRDLERPFLDQKLNVGYTNAVQFRLCSNGVTIESGPFRLVSENGEVHQDPFNFYTI